MQSYTHFTLSERESLAILYREGKTISEIARVLGRNKSSVSREIKRNKSSKGNYQQWQATCSYLHRRKRCKRKFRFDETKLREFVIEKLNKFWSPEAIVVHWRWLHPLSTLSFSTIYTAIKNKRLPDILEKTHLRRRGKRKYCHKNTQTIKPEHKIHDRPCEANLRQRLGDLEGDTLSGGIGKGCVVTLVDRKSRMLFAKRSTSRDSELVKTALLKAVGGQKIYSITLDNGSEFAKYKEIEQELKATIYFADPRSPWQRGTNENTNDLLRFFFPKGTDFRKVTDQQLQHAVDLINNKPKKCLDWLSPIDFISLNCCT